MGVIPLLEDRGLRIAATTVACLASAACSSEPLSPYTADAPPLALLPVSQAGVRDARGRFREVFDGVLEAGRDSLPDWRPCEEALTRVGDEPAGTGAPVGLGPSRSGLVAVLVPGVGWDCFDDWLDLRWTVAEHVRRFGFDLQVVEVASLSSCAANARQIRDALLAMPAPDGAPRLVLVGYSKGAPDILEALVAYPEILPWIAAVVSVAGAVGGSPLANDADPSDLALLTYWPGADCTTGDGGAVESLRPATRRTWLARHPLPPELPTYSVVTYPRPERISSVLGSSYAKLSHIDGRNDSQLLCYDQVIPGSTLVAYLDADHWAVAVPVARGHPLIASMFVDQNDYPREALLEALLRFVEEDLERAGR